MMKFFVCGFFTVIFFSCSSVDTPPRNVIKPKEMKSLLWDVMRAQTLARENSLKDSSLDVAVETKVLTQKIFQIHRTDSTHFTSSYNWYVKHPDILKLIFDSLYVQKQRESDTRLKAKEKKFGHPM